MPNPQAGKNRPFFATAKNLPEVIAHRGGAGEWPGETIYAFEQAAGIGVDVLEMDIRYTSDYDFILMHNANLKETTDVDEKVSRLTSDHIQHLDAAYQWRRAGKVFPQKTNVTVPRLETVLQQFPGRRMVIEIKPRNFPIALVTKLGNLIMNYQMQDKVLIASAWSRPLRLFRNQYPRIATSASVFEMVIFRYLNKIKPGVDAIQTMSKFWIFKRISKAFIEKAHAKNLVVHGWTVNTRDEMQRLVDIGIDGIITDYPSTLKEVLGRS
ncbi:MAG TPA: glycerophosphodiester phosphodiesterase [Pyrinomonadaceae bacterium]|nr:glycerophosphodiester phosphodiesterase [Pyrinomonadaceae bacterium]